jgi:chitodextrinase
VAPSDVTNAAAVPGDASVDITWTDPSDTDFTHVSINWTPAGGSSQPVLVDEGVQSAGIAGLEEKTDYTFTLVAVDTASNKSTGVEVEATTLDVTPPGEVTLREILENDTKEDSIAVSWQNPSDSDFVGTRISVNPAVAGYPKDLGAASGGDTIENLVPDTLYTITVQTRDAAGNISPGVSKSAKTDFDFF